VNDRPEWQWIVEALDLYEDALLRYAAWALRDRDLAQEVVQETFLRLCREDPEKIRSHVAQWLFTVCRNLISDTRKREARMTPIQENDLGFDSKLEQREAVGEIFHLVQHLPKNLEQREAVGEIFHLVQHLPKNQREVVYLKFQCDLSYKEISEVTKLSIGNVGLLLHTALKAIRKRVLSESARRDR
jgi:RNA polymerase sigma-70 factor (ECF subfamily)